MTIHCPKCGAEIDYLNKYVRAEMRYQFYGKDEEMYEDTCADDTAQLDFECPMCGDLLFHDEEQVIKFLQWGDMYPWKGVDDYGQKKEDKDTD